MTNVGSGHLDDTVQLGYLGGELSGRRTEAARRHLGSCELCRARSEELSNVVAEFSIYWKALKAAAPAAPEEWPEIELELRSRQETEPVWRRAASAARRTGRRHPWMIGIAVAAAAAQIWIGAGRLRDMGPPVPSRDVHFALPPAWAEPAKTSAPANRRQPASEAGAPKTEHGNLELDAIAALHRIGADVGEPVELRRSAGGLELVATAVSAAREQEIREALAPFTEVQLRFANPDRQTPALAPRESDAPAEERLQGIRAKLDEQLGSAGREAMEGRALEQSAHLLARLHALDDLEHRFPAEVRSRFTTGESTLFEHMRADHLGHARESLAELQTVFDSIGDASGVSSTNAAHAESVLENARRLDEAIGVMLGGAPSRKSPADLMAAASASLSALRRELEAMR